MTISLINLGMLIVALGTATVSSTLYFARKFGSIDQKLDIIGAVLRATSETNPQIDEGRVTEALSDGGLEPEDFLVDE